MFARRCPSATIRNRSQPSAVVRNRSQPFATVRNRSQPFATVRNRSREVAVTYKFCKMGPFWSFPASHSFISRGRRGTSWHSHMFQDVSNVVFCVAGAILLRHLQNIHCICIPAQVLSRISEGSTHGEHGRFLRAVLPKGPYIPSAGTSLRDICQACLGHIHAERVRFPG